MEEKKNKKGIVYLIIILIVIVLGLIGFIVYDKTVNDVKKNNDENNKKSTTTTTVGNNTVSDIDGTYKFSYKNHELTLLNKLDNINEIYAIAIKINENNYELYVKYMNETEVKLATVIPIDNCQLEYRSLDMENNKLYYIINSKETGTVFELYYIDLNKLDKGAVSLDNFNSEFMKENTWKTAAGTEVYPSQIYVKNDIIYYTDFNEKSLKKYNIKTNVAETIIKNIVWYDYFVDKINNKIFYINNNKLYLSDLEGKNQIELENSIYNGSAFWTNAYYNNEPVFVNPISVAIDDKGENIDDIYIFDYTSSSFKKIKENISNYTILHNNIKEITTENIVFDKTFFIK